MAVAWPFALRRLRRVRTDIETAYCACSGYRIDAMTNMYYVSSNLFASLGSVSEGSVIDYFEASKRCVIYDLIFQKLCSFWHDLRDDAHPSSATIEAARSFLNWLKRMKPGEVFSHPDSHFKTDLVRIPTAWGTVSSADHLYRKLVRQAVP
jgi:hypothetical protein